MISSFMSALSKEDLLALVRETIEKEHGIVVSDVKLDGPMFKILVPLPAYEIKFPETLLENYDILTPEILRPDGVMFTMFIEEFMEKYGLLEQLAEHTKLAFLKEHKDACEDVQASIDYDYMEENETRPFIKLIVRLKPGKRFVFDSLMQLVEIIDNTLVLRIISDYAGEILRNSFHCEESQQ